MHRVIARARDEHGFTMITVMAVMFCVTLLSIAALSAAQGDLKPGGHDKSRKVAYAAAEAGVQNYLFLLSQDLDYWAKCTTSASPHAVNDAWNGVAPAADPRTWRNLPGSRSRYTIELIPANGASACSVADPEGTMIDAASGTFKIRATGQDTTTAVKRSIVVTLKRRSFLDFLYFTDKETRSPGLYGMNVNSRTTREKTGAHRDLLTWAREECSHRYWGDDPALGNRGAPNYDGEAYILEHRDAAGRVIAAGWYDMDQPFPCNEADFKPGDRIAGPLHSNDELFITCGSDPPHLGDSVDDVIETSGLGRIATTPADPDAGWRGCSGGSLPYVNFSTTPTLSDRGTWKAHAAPLTLPLTNSALKHDTAAAYRFKGTTKIALHGTSMRVTGKREDGTVLDGADVPIPADGVVYVSTAGSCPEYESVDSGAEPDTCGNLELQGDYATSVTFTAENDIVVKQDVTRTVSGSPYLLGLIATNYVRVDHPVMNCDPASPVTCNFKTGCDNAPATPRDVDIEAAILSLTRSFIVDNWFCGASLGTLKIYGAIAQMYRGLVTRSNGPELGNSGYVKDYVYDTKLKYRSPPHYVDPVEAQWGFQTLSELAPAR
jgi:hypothetical protein